MRRCFLGILLALTTGSAAADVRTLMVTTPTGQPAVGAEAVVAPGGEWVRITDGKSFDVDPSYQRSTAGQDGQLQFTHLSGSDLLVVIHPDGYARFDAVQLGDVAAIQLQPWVHVQGRVRVGSNPGANRRVFAETSDQHPDELQRAHMYAWSYAQSAPNGEFSITCLPAGKVEVGLEIDQTVGQWQDFTAKPGQTLWVGIGGVGRPLVGNIVLPKELVERTDWKISYATVDTHIVIPPLPVPAGVARGPMAAQQEWYRQFVTSPAGKEYQAEVDKLQNAKQRYVMQMHPDASYSVDDVPEGSYSSFVELRSTATRAVAAWGEEYFTVPKMEGGRSDQPLRLPDLPLEMVHHVRVPDLGEPAPDFSVVDLDGRPLKLADFRGKFVLLEFWATWCGPCRGAIPHLKNLYEHFGKTGRLAMISLSIDEKPYAPKKLVDEQAMAWTQGFLGIDSTTETAYGADQYGVPSMWLIDPQGKVIARPYLGENTDQLQQKITASLAAAMR